MEMGKQKKRRKQRKRRHQRRKQKATTTAAAAAAAVGAPQLPSEIWCSTYKSLLAWHQAQVRSVCGQQIESTQAESCSENEEEEAYEQLEEQHWVADTDDVEEVDEEYLKFLEITLKHQQELKRSRAAAAAAAAEA